MKLQFTLMALIWALSPGLFAQDTTALVAYWQEGEQQVYKRTQIRKEWKNGEVSREEERSLWVSFTILEESSQHYLVRYQIDSLAPAHGETLLSESDRLAEMISSQLVYEFTTDETGEFQELKNWKEIRDKSSTVLDAVFASNEGLSSKEKNAAKALFKQMMGSQEQVAGILNKELTSLFQFYGYLYPVDDTLRFEDQLPNPFGGDPFPASSALILAYEEGNTQLKFHYTMAIDPEKGAEALKQMIVKMAGSMEKSKKATMMAELDKLAYTIEDETSLWYDAETGWALNSQYQRVITVSEPGGITKRIDRISFQRQ